MKWTIEYDNDAEANGGEGFGEWWDVTDGNRSFKCFKEEDAKWLAEFLSSRQVGQDPPSQAMEGRP